MTELRTVLNRAFERAGGAAALPVHRLGPDASWVPAIVMTAIARVELPQLSPGGQRQEVGPSEVRRILSGFSGEWWQRTLELVSAVPPLCAAVLRSLRGSRGAAPRGADLRGMRQKATSRLASHYHRTGRLANDDELIVLRHDVKHAVLLSSHELLGEQAFIALLTDSYATQAWMAARPSPEQIGLGTRSQPPLCEPALRTVLVGTDRDLYSRYRLYYDLRARSKAAQGTGSPDEPPAIERFLRNTPTEIVAGHELRRSAHPYGLRQPAHHAVLPVTLQALSSPRPDFPVPTVTLDVHEPEPLVDGSEVTAAILHATYAITFRRNGWHIGIDLADLEGYVMRRLWNDLHRWERETESVAGRRWFVARLKLALTQYPRERAVIARRTGSFLPLAPPTTDQPDDADWTAEMTRSVQTELGAAAATATVTVLPEPVKTEETDDPATPEVLMHTAFQALSLLDPTTLVDWLREADQRSAREVAALVAPACRASHLDAEAANSVAFLALRVLRSVAPS